MKLADIIAGEYEVERAERISEEVGDLMRKGLDLYEKAFNSRFVDIVSNRDNISSSKCDPLELREYSLGNKCDKFLKRKLRHENRVRENYYKTHPQIRPSANEDETQMPPLGMVPALAYTSGLKNLFLGLNKLERKELSDMFGIKSEEIIKIFDHFLEIRNNRSHDQGQYRDPEFAFCLTGFEGPSEITVFHKGRAESLNLCNNFFGTMTLLGHMLSNLPHKNTYLSAGEWRYKMAEQLSMMPKKVLIEMGFLDGWLDHRIWRRSRRKSIQEISAMYGINFQILEEDYNNLGVEIKKKVDSSTQFISNKLVERGWDTGDNLMDNLEWTARACVMKSVLGIGGGEYGFPVEYLNLAKVLANGSDNKDDMLNAINDYRARKIYNDSIVICLPMGVSDEVILEKIERWMMFDKKRRDSDFDKSFLMESKIVRNGGSIITIKDIDAVSMSPFIMGMHEEAFDEFDINPYNFNQSMDAMLVSRKKDVPEWFKLRASNEHRHKVFDVHRRSLLDKIGENGIKKVIYNNSFNKLDLWPHEIVIDLNEANPDFKVEVEEGYKFRDPETVGCEPYEADFHYPFMLEDDIEKRLQEELPTKSPFCSVDNALCYSYRYYFNMIRKQLRNKIDSTYIDEVGMLPSCRKLIAISEGKFRATFHVDIMLKDITVVEMESVLPVEVEEKNGELHLVMTKMRRACAREVDKLVKKAVRKIRQRGSRQ